MNLIIDDGHYVYSRSEYVDEPAEAVLFIRNILEDSCLSFWYYMFGGNVQNLTVTTRNNGTRAEAVFFRSGSQEDQWHPAKMTMTATSPYEVCIIFYNALHLI